MYDLSALRPSVRSQINAAQLPVRTVGWEMSDLKDYDGVTQPAINQWVSQVHAGNIIKAQGNPLCGKGLLLVGKPGHGKTTLASVVLQDVLRTSEPSLWGSADTIVKRPVIFVDYPKLLRIQQRAWKDDDGDESILMDQIYGDSKVGNISILVLDDLGKEHRTASGWAENTFDALLRARYNAGLPTIVTTNVPLKSWGEVYGEAMESFAHEAFLPINVVSAEGDRRNK